MNQNYIGIVVNVNKKPFLSAANVPETGFLWDAQEVDPVGKRLYDEIR